MKDKLLVFTEIFVVVSVLCTCMYIIYSLTVHFRYEQCVPTEQEIVVPYHDVKPSVTI